MKSLAAFLLLCLAFVLGFAAPLSAQETSPAPTVSAPAPSIPPDADPATATRAWLDTVPPDKREKSDAYFEGGYWLILWHFLLAAAISIFLLSSSLSARIRDFAERISRFFAYVYILCREKLFPNSKTRRIYDVGPSGKPAEGEKLIEFKALQVWLYGLAYVLLTTALTFPLTVYERFFREHKYGFATQTFGPWLGDQLKGLGFALIALPLLLIVLYAVFRKAPRSWWIWATGVMVLFSLFASFVFPVFVAPAFNKYTPLEDPALREPILALARANQIPVDKVFVVDASRQTTRVSANVAGFLGTTRIALNDNLIKQCTLAEIREVMGHEMGHYVLNHGAKLTIYAGIFMLIGFGLTRLVFDSMIRKYGAAWGVRGIGDPAALPLLLLILVTYSFLMTPFDNTAVRVTEAEADIFGLNTAREPDGFAKVALKLGEYRKLDPTPLEEFIFFDHPSGRARIRMAMDWKAAKLPTGGAE